MKDSSLLISMNVNWIGILYIENIKSSQGTFEATIVGLVLIGYIHSRKKQTHGFRTCPLHKETRSLQTL